MKKIIYLIAAAIIFPVIGKSQTYNSNYYNNNANANKDGVFVTEWEYDVYSTEFNASRKKLEEFISKKNYDVLKQDETRTTHTFNFQIPKSDTKIVDSLISTLGYISSKELRSYSNATQLEEAKLELQYLEEKKMEYEKMQMKMDSVKSSKYYDHWNRTRDIDEQIFNAKKKIKMVESVVGIYTMRVTIRDEVTSPSYTRINFVHMPGAEYTYLMLENPKVNLSHAVYQGVNIRYLFTKGKSYFELGAFKAAKSDIKKDTAAFSELFVLDFGQDFYSRYFGRGSNKFMNLYVGYKAGLALASNDIKLQVLPTISPSIGVELFKNKYVLFDVKGSYFLPLVENRHMRGLGVSGAINFVF